MLSSHEEKGEGGHIRKSLVHTLRTVYAVQSYARGASPSITEGLGASVVVFTSNTRLVSKFAQRYICPV